MVLNRLAAGNDYSQLNFGPGANKEKLLEESWQCHFDGPLQVYYISFQWISASPVIDRNSHQMALSKNLTLKNILANFFDSGF